jgi:hypothetical protein
MPGLVSDALAAELVVLGPKARATSGAPVESILEAYVLVTSTAAEPPPD